MASKMPPESKDRVSIDTLAFGTGLSAGKLFTGVVTGLTGPDDPAGFVSRVICCCSFSSSSFSAYRSKSTMQAMAKGHEIDKHDKSSV